MLVAAHKAPLLCSCTVHQARGRRVVVVVGIPQLIWKISDESSGSACVEHTGSKLASRHTRCATLPKTPNLRPFERQCLVIAEDGIAIWDLLVEIPNPERTLGSFAH